MSWGKKIRKYLLGELGKQEKAIISGHYIFGKNEFIDFIGKLWTKQYSSQSGIKKLAKKKKMNILDATCPLVYEIHQEVKKLDKDGRQIIVIGDHKHDEVMAIADQANNTIVLSSKEEAEALRKIKRAGVCF